MQKQPTCYNLTVSACLWFILDCRGFMHGSSGLLLVLLVMSVAAFWGGAQFWWCKKAIIYAVLFLFRLKELFI